MITLPQRLTAETDLAAGLPSGKSTDAAADFLALLAGALGIDDAPGKTAPLNLADLHAASSQFPKGLLSQDGDAPSTVKLADLLAAKDTPGDERLKGLSDAQALLSALTPSQKNSALAALSQSVQIEDDSALSDDDLASLSALFAMLPGQSTAPAVSPDTAPTLSAAPRAGGRTLAPGVPGALADNDSRKGNSDTAPLAAADSAKGQAFTPVIAAASASAEIASTPSPVTPGVALNTVAQALPPPLPTSAAPVLSAPLGSHEWQQSLSQHITLFSRQGQQSAELRLHPEDLGQVHISLKIDDNQAQLQMVSPHGHVRAALEAALPVLRTQLAESGIQLGQSSISSESFTGQQHSSSQQQTPRTPGQTLRADDDDGELLAPASLQSAARGNGAVDIFA